MEYRAKKRNLIKGIMTTKRSSEEFWQPERDQDLKEKPLKRRDGSQARNKFDKCTWQRFTKIKKKKQYSTC